LAVLSQDIMNEIEKLELILKLKSNHDSYVCGAFDVFNNNKSFLGSFCSLFEALIWHFLALDIRVAFLEKDNVADMFDIFIFDTKADTMRKKSINICDFIHIMTHLFEYDSTKFIAEIDKKGFTSQNNYYTLHTS